MREGSAPKDQEAGQRTARTTQRHRGQLVAVMIYDIVTDGTIPAEDAG